MSIETNNLDTFIEKYDKILPSDWGRLDIILLVMMGGLIQITDIHMEDINRFTELLLQHL